MPQAFRTKYIPATNTRGSRISARCDRGSIIIAVPQELSGDDCHRFAVDQLIARFVVEDQKQYGTPPQANPWKREYVTGGLPDGTCAHVYSGADMLRNAAQCFMEQTSVTNRKILRAALNSK